MHRPEPASRIDLHSVGEPTVSILVASSSRTDLLIKCLSALERNGSRQIQFETIVVLNGTEPEVEHTVRGLVTGITLLHSKVNLGLAGASNLARAHARGKYLVLLHDDTEIEPGWLDALVCAAKMDPHAGAIGSKILFPDGTLQHAGAVLWQDGATMRLSDPTEKDDDLRRAVDYTGSCAVLVRVAVWDAIGGLDEQFYPAYYVDANMAMSIRKVGYYTAIEPKAVVRHHLSASSDPASRRFYASTNKQRFLKKWQHVIHQQVPGPEGDAKDAMSAAVARAREFAERCRSSPPPPIAPRSLPFDADQQQVDHALKQARLQDDLAKYAGIASASRSDPCSANENSVTPRARRSVDSYQAIVRARERLNVCVTALRRWLVTV